MVEVVGSATIVVVGGRSLPVGRYPTGVRAMVTRRNRIVADWTSGRLEASEAISQLDGLTVQHRGSRWRIQPGSGGAQLVEVRADGEVVVHPDPSRRRLGGWVLLVLLIVAAFWGFWDSSSAGAQHLFTDDTPGYETPL